MGCFSESKNGPQNESAAAPIRRIAVTNPVVERLISAAIEQVGLTTGYDPAYRTLSYPNGDVPIHTGVCSDVLIRAFRFIDMDFQKEVHEDMRKGFGKYPQLWNMSRPDPNIDHRRVPNLMRFFQRKGWEIPISDEARHYKPGDIVTWIIPPNLTHIGLVTNRIANGDRLMVVHNYGFGTVENDALFLWKQTGHFRISQN
ncbi:MAG TPA: DUF1287 domain-containing protein [Bacteroidetes bacterium]|nr:DUF1287 domain-containing protein [Bacteroidota bacterium]